MQTDQATTEEAREFGSFANAFDAVDESKVAVAPEKEEAATEEAPPKEDAPPSDEQGLLDRLDDLLKDEDAQPDADATLPDEDEVEESEESSDESEDEEAKRVAEEQGEKAGEAFKKLKSSLRTEQERAADLERQLTELREKSADSEELTKLKEQVEQYEAELAAYKVEATAEYKASVQEPIQKVLDFANALADKYEVDANRLIDALGETDESKQDEMLSELLTGFSDRDKVKLYQAAAEIPTILKREQEIRENSKEALRELEEKQTLAQKEAAEKARAEMEQSLDTVWQKLQEKVPLFESEDATLQRTLAKVKADAKAIDLGSVDNNTRAFATYAGLMLPVVLREFKTLQARTDELSKELAVARGSSPGAAPRTSDRETRRPPADLSFEAAVEAALG